MKTDLIFETLTLLRKKLGRRRADRATLCDISVDGMVYFYDANTQIVMGNTELVKNLLDNYPRRSPEYPTVFIS